MSALNGTYYPAAFIPDGYSEPFYLAGIEGLHGPLRGVRRPATLEDNEQYVRDTEKVKGVDLQKAAARWMCGKLVSWSLESPLTPDNLRRLRPRLFYRLQNVLLGVEASDVDPEWSKLEQEASETDRQAAAAQGKNVGQYLAERDAKNSPMG